MEHKRITLGYIKGSGHCSRECAADTVSTYGFKQSYAILAVETLNSAPKSLSITICFAKIHCSSVDYDHSVYSAVAVRSVKPAFIFTGPKRRSVLPFFGLRVQFCHEVHCIIPADLVLLK